MYKKLKNKIEEIIQLNEQNNIDYIGINIDEEKKIKYKIYYSDYCKSNQNIKKTSIKLLEQLAENNFINENGPIDDNYSGIFRCDLKIKAIKDDDIIKMINITEKETELIKENIDEILNFSQMKVLDMPDTKYASMYYIGFIIEEKIIKALKLHFMTRKEKNSMIKYDNIYYMEYLRALKIEEMCYLLDYSQNIVLDKIGNLYLIGVDYFQNKTKKYKVYYNFENSQIKDIIKYVANDKIQEELRKVEKFVDSIGCLKFCILAFCMDTNQKFSINLYFKLK